MLLAFHAHVARSFRSLGLSLADCPKKRNRRSLGWIAARDKFAAIGATPSDLLEVADLLHELVGAVGGELLPHVIHPWGGDRRDNPELKRMTEAIKGLFLETSILKQMRASQRWHELQRLPRAREDADGDPMHKEPKLNLDYWPSPLTHPLKLGSLTAHFLNTTDQLRDEGTRMQHCVGFYSDRCLFDDTNIVSLRKSDGCSVSTAELRLIDHGKRMRFELIQHKAYQNGLPTLQASLAMARLLLILNADDLQPRMEEIREELKQRQTRFIAYRQLHADTPNSPHRMRCLKAALKLHVGYERFLEAGRKAVGICVHQKEDPIKPRGFGSIVQFAHKITSLVRKSSEIKWITLDRLPGLSEESIHTLGEMVFRSLTSTPLGNIGVIANLSSRGPHSQQDIDYTAHRLRRTTTPSCILEYSSDQIKQIFGAAYQAQAVQFEDVEYTYLLVRDPIGSYIYRWPAGDTRRNISLDVVNN